MLVPGVAIAAGAFLLGLMLAKRPASRPIVRLGVTDAGPFAHAVVHDGIAYLSGVTAQADGSPISADDSVEEQTRRVLNVIDKRLALAGTSRAKLLQAQVWLKDIERDFKAMNGVWNAWVTEKPVRATVEAKLATPAMLVEIQVVAAI